MTDQVVFLAAVQLLAGALTMALFIGAAHFATWHRRRREL